MLNKIEFAIKHSKFIQWNYILIGSFIIRFIGLFVKQDKKLILFSSFRGLMFNDSPKLIFEEIKRRYGNSYKYVWAFVDPKKFISNDYQTVRLNSLKYFIIAQKAKYWVTNVNIERGLKFKKKSVVYLDTWHGICLDTIGNDRPGRKDYDFSKMNYLCVSAPFDEKIYKTAFKATEKNFFRVGMPRNDILVKNEIDKDALKKELGLPLDKKIILYAPTWRENLKTQSVDSFESPIHLDKWRKTLSKDYILLFRAHSISKKIYNITFDDFCYDFSSYPDTNKLLTIVDILISDYSSILIDYSILERPIFNFGYDYDTYKIQHGFYVDYEKEMPNGIIREEDELINRIVNVDFDLEKEKTKVLKEKYAAYSLPNATEKCVDALFAETKQL